MIALVRHPTPAGTHGMCYGRLDVPLADPDRDIQAIVDLLRLWRAPVVYTSPAARCRLVAERLSAEVQVDTRLAELDFGAWEGVRWDDIPRAALDAWASDPLGFAPPDGESGAMLVVRVQSFAHELRATPGRRIVVTHGGPLKVLSRLLRGAAVDLLASAPEWGSVEIV
jgi:alpha-ribazole phosphatase